jgi:hypothetical protein
MVVWFLYKVSGLNLGPENILEWQVITVTINLILFMVYFYSFHRRIVKLVNSHLYYNGIRYSSSLLIIGVLYSLILITL